MQLPEYFSPDKADQLLHFLDRKPKEIEFAIELRNKEWFTKEAEQLRNFAKQISELNTAILITDVSGRRDVCHCTLSNQALMIRLVGNAGHSTDLQRISNWVELIFSHQSQLKDVYLFFHQPAMENIPKMVNQFIQKLEEKGLKSPIPVLNPKYQPNIQLRLF